MAVPRKIMNERYREFIKKVKDLLFMLSEEAIAQKLFKVNQEANKALEEKVNTSLEIALQYQTDFLDFADDILYYCMQHSHRLYMAKSNKDEAIKIINKHK